MLLCLVAKRWVCLVGINSLLIDGGGGFDCENVNFAGYIDCENVKFDSGFALVLGFGKNMKNKFLCSYEKIMKVKKSNNNDNKIRLKIFFNLI